MSYLNITSLYERFISPMMNAHAFTQLYFFRQQPPSTDLCETVATHHPRLLARTKTYLRHITRAFIDPAIFPNDVLDEFIEANATYFLADIKRTSTAFPNALTRYSTSLQKKLDELLKAKYKKTYEIALPQQSIIEQSMSYIWGHCKDKTSEATGFIDKIADAHGFIQLTGWATQNERSLFAIFDLYNYFKYYESIAAYRDILVGLLTPLLPLYYEYRDVTRNEQNLFFKITRILTPMIITAGILVGVGILLAPFAIPEFAFIVLAIPVLYLGLTVAAQYIRLKDEAYYGLRRLYYGGIYEAPEFQENDRLNAAFSRHAKTVQAYYVGALKACDEREASLDNGEPLSERALKDRDTNRVRRQALLLEWFDIHSNQKIGYDKARIIFKNRLGSDTKRLCDSLDEALTEAEATVKKHIDALKTFCHKHPLEADAPVTRIPRVTQKICFFADEAPINQALENIQTKQEEVYNPVYLIHL